MDNFEFSIIIPTHNSELGINKSIESIINQTLDFERNTEIIIIDNNSEDDTKKITEKYISKYPENTWEIYRIFRTSRHTIKWVIIKIFRVF